MHNQKMIKTKVNNKLTEKEAETNATAERNTNGIVRMKF